MVDRVGSRLEVARPEDSLFELSRNHAAAQDPARSGVGEVLEALPHRYPMLLVDRILELTPGDSITAVKAVTVNEPWFAGCAAGEAYPQVLVIESWSQAACILVARLLRDRGERPDGRVPLFGSLRGARILGPVRPGDVLTHRAQLVRALSDTWILAGASTVGGVPSLEVDRAVVALRPLQPGPSGAYPGG
jgi:3-hydroxyacyl-[acyl-carrier-protein] dehydratase